MSAAHTLQTYYRRFLGLGWARIFLVLGVLFTLIAIANPVWFTTADTGGGDYTTATYGWTTVTAVTYESGVWARTLIQSYNARSVATDAIANAAGGSYLAEVILLIVLIVVIALFSLELIHRLPSLGLLVIGLVVVVFALVALLYPIVTVPTAAAADLGRSAITGYWGSTAIPGGTFTWGAALGWWLLLLAVIFGCMGGFWPFLKALRTPMARVPPPPPREWQVER